VLCTSTLQSFNLPTTRRKSRSFIWSPRPLPGSAEPLAERVTWVAEARSGSRTYVLNPFPAADLSCSTLSHLARSRPSTPALAPSAISFALLVDLASQHDCRAKQFSYVHLSRTALPPRRSAVPHSNRPPPPPRQFDTSSLSRASPTAPIASHHPRTLRIHFNSCTRLVRRAGSDRTTSRFTSRAGASRLPSHRAPQTRRLLLLHEQHLRALTPVVWLPGLRSRCEGVWCSSSRPRASRMELESYVASVRCSRLGWERREMVR